MVTYLYPGYASYKNLSQRPANEADIERWLMYWSVIGCVVAIESAEWLINWSVPIQTYLAYPGVDHPTYWVMNRPPERRSLCRLPLYYTIKTIFILYLVLPQTKGASYLYTHHLQPFFNTHEPQIDATLSSLASGTLAASRTSAASRAKLIALRALAAIT